MSTTWVSVVLALVLAVALAVPHSSTARTDTFQSHVTKRHYCGRTLVDALKMVCQDHYSPPMSMKGGQEMESDDSHPFRSRASANRFRRQSRGIRDECCLNACSIDDLASYCPSYQKKIDTLIHI